MIIAASMVFAWSADFNVGRSGGGYVLSILVYAIGDCSIVRAMSQDVSYVEGNPSSRR
jgi:hypothetical protein